jgi:hypothetical protein
LLSKIYNWFWSDVVSTQVSHPYVTVGRIIVLCIWISLVQSEQPKTNRQHRC